MTGPDIVNLQLHLAALVGILLNRIANIESTFGFNIARLRTLSEGNAIHYIVALVVHQFEFDVFLSAANHLACAIIVNTLGAKDGLGIARPEGRKLAQLLVKAEGDILKVEHGINIST